MAPRFRLLAASLAVASACAWTVAGAGAGGRDWAGPEIRAVTQAGVLGRSAATFGPDAPLTQGALAGAIAATDAVQHPPTAPAAKPAPLTVLSTLPANAVVTGTVDFAVHVRGAEVDHVGFLLDGAEQDTQFGEPFGFALDTSSLAAGPHRVSVEVGLASGGSAVAAWSVTVANAPGSVPTQLGPAVKVPVTLSSQPAALQQAAPTAARTLYRASTPSQPVTIKQLDAALVGYLGLGGAAREIQRALQDAGLQPPASTGTEAVARLLGLRLNHPSGQDDLELLPSQPATRAEAAWSFAQVLHLDAWAIDAAHHAADELTPPELTPWPQRILTTAVHYVGYPYIWGGTSPTAQTLFGVHSVGGFDCSGFVWRVYKLTPYDGAPQLATVLRGRTTYQLSGEVPKTARIAAAKLQPADVMFFGAHGPASKPSEIDHAALYLGNGWFIQSSGQGVTLLPFDGWYAKSFAWGRRPLREANLAA